MAPDTLSGGYSFAVKKKEKICCYKTFAGGAGNRGGKGAERGGRAVHSIMEVPFYRWPKGALWL